MNWFIVVSVVILTLLAWDVAQSQTLPQSKPEPTPISVRTHQLVVTVPGFQTKVRGKPQGEVACKLDMASERMTGGWPDGTTFECRDLKVRK